MRRYLLPVSFILIFVLPNLLFSVLTHPKRENPVVPKETEPDIKSLQMIQLEDNDSIMEVALEEYILCVLLGEVPASFESEALRAQAIATRTYTLRRYMEDSKHDNAHVCTDASCCQAYIPVDSFLEQGHTEWELRKIEDAVKSTSCQVISYNGELIEATYFSCAGDRTENASDVWGREVPYLISVKSSGEKISANYQKTIVLTIQQFVAQLGLDHTETLNESDISVSYTTGGGVAQAKIAGQTYTGQEIRTLLELPSTVITFEIDDDVVKITTKGSGHRVGMSQYGAQAMALDDKNHEEILRHYYPGTNLITLTDRQLNAIFDKEENL